MSRTYKDMPYNVRVDRALKGKVGSRNHTVRPHVNHVANNYEYVVSYCKLRYAYPGWDKFSMEEDKNLLRKMYEAKENNDGHTVEFRHRIRNAHDFFKDSNAGRLHFDRTPHIINSTMSKNIGELDGLNIKNFEEALHGSAVSFKTGFFVESEEFSAELKNSKTILELEIRVPVIRRYSEDEVFSSYLYSNRCHCSCCDEYDSTEKSTHFDAHEWVNFFNSNNGSINIGYEEELDRYYSTKDDRDNEHYFEMMALNSIDEDENYSAYVKKSVEDKNDNVVYVATFGS